MWGFTLIKSMIEIQEINQWLMVSIVSALLFSVCDIYMFMQLFEIKSSKFNVFKIIIINAIVIFIPTLIIPVMYNRAFNFITTALVFRFMFKQKLERCILGEVINAIIIISAEVIFSKLFCILYSDVHTYANGMYNYKYKLSVNLSIILCRFIAYLIVKVKNFTLVIPTVLNKNNRNKIIAISIIGCTLIFFSTVAMLMYISDFPYSIFLIDIVSLMIYFCISIEDIYRIIKLEEMDNKIQNLESYNKTLLIMYDNIRGFRHDFSNFVQALDGYVETNNIEGIREMSSSLIKECKDVNGMGILDPNVINNSAVYSIITNKYYLAQENNISMNIEIMIDLKELNIATYNLCRILGILLDNAIEATKECKEKIINIQFKKDYKVNRKLIVIENSYNKIDIDLDKIYEKGYTTKKDNSDNHGLGLWTVRKILCKSDNLNLYTSKDKLFRQQLEIYEA